ncbi:hypothetical protein [Streptomyces sp. MMS24-I29]
MELSECLEWLCSLAESEMQPCDLVFVQFQLSAVVGVVVPGGVQQELN